MGLGTRRETSGTSQLDYVEEFNARTANLGTMGGFLSSFADDFGLDFNGIRYQLA
jgi:hypothetical protein